MMMDGGGGGQRRNEEEKVARPSSSARGVRSGSWLSLGDAATTTRQILGICLLLDHFEGALQRLIHTHERERALFSQLSLRLPLSAISALCCREGASEGVSFFDF